MPETHPVRPLPVPVRRFLDEHRYAMVATVNPDGTPHQALVWYLVEDDPDLAGGTRIVVNSAEGRRWPGNLRRRPAVSIAVHDGLDWVGLSGEVTVHDDRTTAQGDIAAMARLNDPPEEAERVIREQFERQQRVSFRLRPTLVHAEITAADHVAEG